MSFHKTMSTELAFFHVLFPQYVNSDVQNNYSTLTVEELLFFLSRNIYEIMRFKKRRKKKEAFGHFTSFAPKGQFKHNKATLYFVGETTWNLTMMIVGLSFTLIIHLDETYNKNCLEY